MGESSDVPIGWFTAEQAARSLITRSGGGLALATFDYRATSDVLALTSLLAGIDIPAADLPISSVRRIGAYLAADQSWAAWCQAALAQPPTTIAGADVRFARRSWGRLIGSELLGGFTVSGVAADVGPLAACCLGLSHARRTVAAYCRRWA